MESSVRAQPRIQVTVYICCEMSLAVPLGLGNFCLAGPFHCSARVTRARTSIPGPDPTADCRIPLWMQDPTVDRAGDSA